LNLKQTTEELLSQIGAAVPQGEGDSIDVHSPIDGSHLARLRTSSEVEIQRAVEAADRRFSSWSSVPPPRRGAVVREFGQAVRARKDALARLIAIETGKILGESLGEVQEVIDICDFAVGLSRQLHGLTIASERDQHKLLETWHPLGVCAVISAFNFPAAVWAWNAAVALVCGNTLVWKPSEKTPLTALAMQALLGQAVQAAGEDPEGLSIVVLGARGTGEQLVRSHAVKLVSATGSTGMGRSVAVACATRFTRCILELGGNNAAIVTPSADLDLSLRAVTFAAAGTAGQRCTSLRRLFVHRSIYSDLVPRIVEVFGSITVGNPLEPATLVGPLVDSNAGTAMAAALGAAQAAGGRVHHGKRVEEPGLRGGTYVRPAVVEMTAQRGPMLEETFAPILYVMPYDSLDEAVALNNAASHGLSSAIFTRDLLEAEFFTSSKGSDCGIVNVNIGTSGAEIGGAFGGEKETGGGRESGSDAWKGYMRRATNTINYGRSLPLAQGVRFDI